MDEYNKGVTMSVCACIGRVGKDPYCPCEMMKRNLPGDYVWTDEQKAELYKVLDTIFQRKQDVN